MGRPAKPLVVHELKRGRLVKVDLVGGKVHLTISRNGGYKHEAVLDLDSARRMFRGGLKKTRYKRG